MVEREAPPGGPAPGAGAGARAGAGGARGARGARGGRARGAVAAAGAGAAALAAGAALAGGAAGDGAPGSLHQAAWVTLPRGRLVWGREALAARLGLPGAGAALGCTSLDGPLCGAWGGPEALVPEGGWGEGQLDAGRAARRPGEALKAALGDPDELKVKFVLEDGEVVDFGNSLGEVLQSMETMLVESFEKAMAEAAEEGGDAGVLAALGVGEPLGAAGKGAVSDPAPPAREAGPAQPPREIASEGEGEGEGKEGVRLASFSAATVERAGREVMHSMKNREKGSNRGKALPQAKRAAPQAEDGASTDEILALLRLLGLDVSEGGLGEVAGEPAGESDP